jgi:hypothetical protein
MLDSRRQKFKAWIVQVDWVDEAGKRRQRKRQAEARGNKPYLFRVPTRVIDLMGLTLKQSTSEDAVCLPLKKESQ